MGVPTSEIGYSPAMPRRWDHEVHKGHVVALEKKKYCKCKEYVDQYFHSNRCIYGTVIQ
jgi:hypothetical protein